MEYSPPPLFKQGASARAKVVFFSLIALILLVADSRMRSLAAVRQAVGTVLYPLQVVALAPRDAMFTMADYFSTVTELQRENQQMRQARTKDAVVLQQVQQLSAENTHLRNLLEANERLSVKTVMSEILYDARDAFTRKIVLDRGTQHGVAPGQPVIDDSGVVGQVTRVFPFTSEVTLLTDKDQAIPVQVVRSGLRSIAYGQGHSGALDLRFMPVNADIQNGDVLVTSGLDGVYPPGLEVAKVVRVETKSNDAFARIVCLPLAGINRNRQLLILLTDSNIPPRPAADAAQHGGDTKRRLGAASSASTAPIAATAAVPVAAAPAPAATTTTTTTVPAPVVQAASTAAAAVKPAAAAPVAAAMPATARAPAGAASPTAARTQSR